MCLTEYPYKTVCLFSYDIHCINLHQNIFGIKVTFSYHIARIYICREKFSGLLILTKQESYNAFLSAFNSNEIKQLALKQNKKLKGLKQNKKLKGLKQNKKLT